MAAFVTQGGRGGDKAIAQLTALFGLAPVGELILDAKEVTSGACEQQLEEFIAKLAARPTRTARAPSHQVAA